VLLYAAEDAAGMLLGKGLLLKGKIWLRDGARVQMLPATEHAPHGFAVVSQEGKGYTWLADSAQEQREWFEAISAAIDESAGRSGRTASMVGAQVLARLASKPLGERLESVQRGMVLTKYNQRDGKSSQRWVKLSGSKVMWGDAKSHACSSDLDLGVATALIHGAKSSAFYKQQGSKSHSDWQCLSIVTKERTLDLACAGAAELFDWYLSLASRVASSTEPLLDEAGLRARIEKMM